jgi:hypothetical protein
MLSAISRARHAFVYVREQPFNYTKTCHSGGARTETRRRPICPSAQLREEPLTCRYVEGRLWVADSTRRCNTIEAWDNFGRVCLSHEAAQGQNQSVPPRSKGTFKCRTFLVRSRSKRRSRRGTAASARLPGHADRVRMNSRCWLTTRRRIHRRHSSLGNNLLARSWGRRGAHRRGRNERRR